MLLSLEGFDVVRKHEIGIGEIHDLQTDLSQIIRFY